MKLKVVSINNEFYSGECGYRGSLETVADIATRLVYAGGVTIFVYGRLWGEFPTDEDGTRWILVDTLESNEIRLSLKQMLANYYGIDGNDVHWAV